MVYTGILITPLIMLPFLIKLLVFTEYMTKPKRYSLNSEQIASNPKWPP